MVCVYEGTHTTINSLVPSSFETRVDRKRKLNSSGKLSNSVSHELKKSRVVCSLPPVPAPSMVKDAGVLGSEDLPTDVCPSCGVELSAFLLSQTRQIFMCPNTDSVCHPPLGLGLGLFLLYRK